MGDIKKIGFHVLPPQLGFFDIFTICMKFKIGIGGLFFKLKIRPFPCFFPIGAGNRFANMVSKLSFPGASSKEKFGNHAFLYRRGESDKKDGFH
jgi:hypothetical protein